MIDRYEYLYLSKMIIALEEAGKKEVKLLFPHKRSQIGGKSERVQPRQSLIPSSLLSALLL